MAWQVELTWTIDTSNPLLPPLDTVRIEVTAPDSETPIFTIDVPAASKTYMLQVGDGTPIPVGDYSLRLRGLNTTLHSISEEFSTWLHVAPPAPATPTLKYTPATELTPPAAPPTA